MESLETATGSPEGQDRDVAPKKCTPEAPKISRSPSLEMEGKSWRQHLQEGPACGSQKAPASGKSRTFEDSISQTQDTEASSFSLQAARAAGRPKRSPSSPERQSCYSGMELQPDTGGKAELKAQKPGKYVCDYCGRACAKPSVLKKHIRSHTGERPYPCIPCGFSFKTKSNLYKHRKSHAHSVKAGTSPFSQNVNADQGSFEGEGELFSDAEQSTDTDEDAFNDPLLLLDSPAEASDHTAVKVLNLISHKKASATSTQDGSSHASETSASPVAAAVEAHRAIQTCTIKQRLALRLSEKRSGDSEHNLSLPSQSSKGSTDSGYFSRSESAEHQTSPPNANAKSYQEIMFGKCYRPSPKQTTAYVSGEAGRCSEKGVSRVFTQEKDTVESIRINTKSLTRDEVKEAQFDSGSDAGTLLRSNSMPTSSAVSLTLPQALRGSHSFDERTSNAGMRRLRRQAAFEMPSNEGHAESDGHGKASDVSLAEMDNYPASGNLQRHAMELATRKRRKEKREEEDLPPPRYEVHHEQSEEMFDSGKDYEVVGHGAVGRLSTQPDSIDMDISVGPETCARKTLGNVISVIQHTKFINRPQADPSDSYKSLRQRQEAFSSFQPMEESFEMDRGDGVLRQSFQLAAKLVRQPNIQVPEIRVTVEPDSPEKAPDLPAKEPEKHVEEFQWPQRSETLAQFPPEKLPPKKKRLRLADIEHSSGESSFESACTSLSRSPSQDSNLSYGSAFSFDREESLKPVSPARQDESGKPLERLAVPGSGRSLSVLHHRQQHEMRRSSSEQAPCNLRKELPEVRSVSFDYGSLDPTSKVRPGDLAKERRRGNLVRQESLSMDAEASHAHAFPSSLPVFSIGNALPHPPHPGLLIPVRIQTHVPNYGSLTYTSVSQIVDNYYDRVSPALTPSRNRAASHAVSIEVLDLSSAKLKTGIPLSLTSRTISTTNASSGGANKRMLSPASSLDLFMEVRQQKRVKEERMFGQIVEELSAVELGKCHLEDDSHGRTLIAARNVTEDRGAESAMESGSLETGLPAYPKETGTERRAQMDAGPQPLFGRDVLVSEAQRRGTPSPFPSLRTATGVSWCYLSYTKPSCSHSHEGAAADSVYAAWHVSSRNPNPPELSTSAALALLQSRQKGGKSIYSMAAMCQPDNGKLVSSLVLWRQTVEQLQRKPEPKETDVNPGKKAKDASFRLKAAKEEWKEREASNTQTAPARIKIFEGGYKSNEDYVYVRGRGRGKYICEECGIRCKKPSMLKKHIRTHTDVRPYICKVCNFAFKTKGNLTKHMKSKAHMKKCLELGVSVSMDETEIQEHDEAPQESKAEVAAVAAAKHQFSDAEYSDGMDEDADDVDEDEDEDDDYEGDSTPKLRSRSTSPQPAGGVASLPVTVTVSGRWPGSDQRDKTAEDDSLSVLSPDQAGFLFDPYSSCLLSPGWESPIRELSPSRLRYPSPRRELSPRGRCSPRWDASPLRPSSPGFSPIQHLSPPVAPERPASPGAEMAGKRESAVRGRQRVVLRAVSPRRGGSHPQRGCGDKSRQQHAKMDVAQQQGAFEMELEQRSISSLPLATGGPPQNLLSHLPLHSQQQSVSLLPLLPVGGALLPASSPSPATSDVPPSPPTSEMAQEERGSPDSGIRDGGQEENVQTCLKAIASLKINTEDPH